MYIYMYILYVLNHSAVVWKHSNLIIVSAADLQSVSGHSASTSIHEGTSERYCD